MSSFGIKLVSNWSTCLICLLAATNPILFDNTNKILFILFEIFKIKVGIIFNHENKILLTFNILFLNNIV